MYAIKHFVFYVLIGGLLPVAYFKTTATNRYGYPDYHNDSRSTGYEVTFLIVSWFWCELGFPTGNGPRIVD